MAEWERSIHIYRDFRVSGPAGRAAAAPNQEQKEG
jgi:hypothetical protein